jgi:hypothetical protein
MDSHLAERDTLIVVNFAVGVRSQHVSRVPEMQLAPVHLECYANALRLARDLSILQIISPPTVFCGKVVPTGCITLTLVFAMHGAVTAMFETFVSYSE